jgi:DNA repair protein RadC
MHEYENRVVAVYRYHAGSLNSPIEIFKSAILNNRASIIVSNQHPFQNVQPSREDIDS